MPVIIHENEIKCLIGGVVVIKKTMSTWLLLSFFSRFECTPNPPLRVEFLKMTEILFRQRVSRRVGSRFSTYSNATCYVVFWVITNG